QVEEAARLLGRPYSARGVIVRGAALGRTIGFPTANVAISEGKILPPGVFACRVLLPGGNLRSGMANVGWRPTVDGQEKRLEVYLFDFTGDLYGEEVRVDFMARLRGEERFPGLEALKAQLARDEAAARAVLASQGEPEDELGRTA
ncbi:MAG TPA: riboflavin kinase, partial [Deinococcales bacterium]|nr:riboflavin kinase [Deinococcales bacterium]